jgi:putative toxin-antitoxin system antitoxin component (TIGR02293 family)
MGMEIIDNKLRVIALATEVFGSVEHACLFLNTPHPELDNECPLAIIQSELGSKRVEEVLWRMEYGLPI